VKSKINLKYVTTISVRYVESIYRLKLHRTETKIKDIQTPEIDKFTSSLLSGKSENANIYSKRDLRV
jgi:hypothetical protein